MNLVSIVIPTYSRNDTLERAIASALKQTYQNIEIIVVDDNPVDSEWRRKTSELMEKYSVESKIRYIQNKKNMGGAGARNEGIKASLGDYIAFLDDDDEYLPENVEKKLRVFQKEKNSQLALVYGFSEYIDHDRVVYTNCKNYNGCCLYAAMRENCIAATSQWMVKKSTIIQSGMFPIVPSKQDSQMMLNILKNGFEIRCVEEVLTRYYMDGDQFTHISNNGRKPLEGELLYREECRKLYHLLNKSQVRNVEYQFATMLYEKYGLVSDSEKQNIQIKQMYRLKPVSALKYFTRMFARSCKHKAFEFIQK